ncbi:unnamed protein product [Adineta ricciae]|uniref:inositol-phosphate phosphatase n=1 Tax=Adineta ricciae TaxID=249248 RepID=A0A816FBM0_ADIRI|nr:unnamed protein product [Adineta ricciae]CAF1658258.1 unnamed protein product [Adineta ricciae]
MFGVKFQPHRSFFILGICLCLFIVYLLSSNHPTTDLKDKVAIENDENINLVDLFSYAYQLTYQAGQAIKLFKNKKENFREIFKKKSFEDLPSEPVTIADLISHSILTNGLKSKFQNLQIVSEEKDSIDDEQFKIIQKKFNVKDKLTTIPQITDENHFLTVPLSSVAVWIDPLDATKEFTEDLTEYVTVMFCVTVDKQPTIGILYSPFTERISWGWVGVNHSMIKRDENSLKPLHTRGVDDIIVSRSHAGQTFELLKSIYRDKQYKIIPAAGSGYKTVQILENYADYYLHITPIKKWDLCAPDALLRANQGTMTTLKNQTISYDHSKEDMLVVDGILATHQRNHGEILNFLANSNLTKYLSKKKKTD